MWLLVVGDLHVQGGALIIAHQFELVEELGDNDAPLSFMDGKLVIE